MSNVLWFSGRSLVGIVRVKTEFDGVHYYIGSPPGEEKGNNEEEDVEWIANWGSRFPRNIGEILFGDDELRNGNAVPIPMNKEQAELMVRVGMLYLEN